MTDTTQLHAYPHESGLAPCKGLTKREWYAGLAMLGLIPFSGSDLTAFELAERAFDVADAMLYTIQMDEAGVAK